MQPDANRVGDHSKTRRRFAYIDNLQNDIGDAG